MLSNVIPLKCDFIKMSIHYWSFVSFPQRNKDEASKSPTSLLTSWKNDWMLLVQKRLVVLIASNDTRWDKWWRQLCGHCTVSTCGTWPHIYLFLKDKKDAPFPRHSDVKEMQQNQYSAAFMSAWAYLHISVKLCIMLTQRGSFGGRTLSKVASVDGRPNKTRYFT